MGGAVVFPEDLKGVIFKKYSPAKQVSFSRSLKNMENKNLIKLILHRKRYAYYKIKKLPQRKVWKITYTRKAAREANKLFGTKAEVLFADFIPL